MTMQLMRHSSLELLFHSGGVQLNPGPDTGSNKTLLEELRPVTSYSRRFVSISHFNVRWLLKRLPEVKFLIEQTKLTIYDLLSYYFGNTSTENILDNEVLSVDINSYKAMVVVKLVEVSQTILRITITVCGSPCTKRLTLKLSGLK